MFLLEISHIKKYNNILRIRAGLEEGWLTMADIKMVRYPNKFKIFMCLMLFIPCLTVIIAILGPTYAYSKVFPYYFSSIILTDPQYL